MKWLVLVTVLGMSSVGTEVRTKRVSRHHRLTTEELHPNQPINSQHSKGERSKVCEGWWCGHGMECQVGGDGMPECACKTNCPELLDDSRRVCGSDGHFYSSPCDLHRKACLTNNVVTVDQLGIACRLSQHRSAHQSAASKFKEQRDPPSPHFYATYKKEILPSNHVSEGTAKRGGDEGFPEDTSTKALVDTTNPDWTFPKTNLVLGRSFEDEDEDDDDSDSDEDEEEVEDLNSENGSSRETWNPPPMPPASLVPPVKEEEHESFPTATATAARSPTCSPEEYEILKDSLLLYSHQRLIGRNRRTQKELFQAGDDDLDAKGGAKSGGVEKDRAEGGKDYLLSLMFSHFDQNNNGALEWQELLDVGQDGNLLPFNNNRQSSCSLVSLLDYDDVDHNRQLNINEFYTAFNKLYSVSVISLDKALEVTRMRATVGDNVELKCDISGSPPIPIVWKRYGFDLAALSQDEEIRVFADGTLFLNKIQLLHAGNYSCQAQRNDKVVQTHILTVQTLPDVKVTPHIVWEKPGEAVTMECRVMGEPFPTVRWLKNDDPLPIAELGGKYEVTGDGIRLRLNDIYFSSTGAYMCMAENSAGKRLDISSLVVIDDTTPTVPGNETQFFVFHDLGISVYDPATCRIQHQIQATDIIPGSQDYVCAEPNGVCEWGDAVKVSSTYVYVTQPKLDRVLVISVSQMVVVDVVSTDRYPVGLDYVPHLDQIWVRCWHSPDPTSQKTLQVIRDAKEKKKHHTVHPEPINSHFDLVESIFLPPPVLSSSQFRHAYVSHKNARGLYKMDLIGLRYTKSIDLTPYNCFPQHLQFSALYGLLIIECYEPVTLKHSGQLVLDLLTDGVIHFKSDRYGRPYLSPDSRKLVTVSHGPDGTTLLVQLVKENGLEFFFDVKTSLNVSDISFFPSQHSHTYDLYASAVDKEDVLFLDLESGKVETVSGVGGALVWSPWKSTRRPISSQGLFSRYLATPSADAVFVLNGLSHTVNCQIGGLSKPHQIIWL